MSTEIVDARSGAEAEPDEQAENWASDETAAAQDQSSNHYPGQLGSPPQEEAVTPEAATQPLLSAQVKAELLERWTEIQVAFVENPQAAVEDAESLVAQIAAKYQRAIQERRSALANEWSDGADTEELRLAIQHYRAFVGVLLPR